MINAIIAKIAATLIVYALSWVTKIIPTARPIAPISREAIVMPLLIVISNLFEFMICSIHAKRLNAENADKMQAIVVNVRAAIMLEQPNEIVFDDDGRQINSPHIHSSQIVLHARHRPIVPSVTKGFPLPLK
jgi:hypothetical protein